MEKVAANWAWKVKSAEQETAYQKRIALLQLNKDASYNNLWKMKVLELDNQVNKLRESNKHTVVKSRLKTKQVKVLEIMEALKQQKKEAEATDQPISGTELKAGIFLSTEGVEIKDTKPPEDKEMYFDNEVCL